MTDKSQTNQDNQIQKPNFPDQTRGQTTNSAPPKPIVPTPPSTKPKKD
jgi:hypothetical protein